MLLFGAIVLTLESFNPFVCLRCYPDLLFYCFALSLLCGCNLMHFCLQFRTHKIIYRRYAGLFFSMCVDITDNELAYLECIHLFVEILDHFFSNVCELDLVFNFHKVCTPFTNLKCFTWVMFSQLPSVAAHLSLHCSNLIVASFCNFGFVLSFHINASRY